jgi:hypothetical protein
MDAHNRSLRVLLLQDQRQFLLTSVRMRDHATPKSHQAAARSLQLRWAEFFPQDRVVIADTKQCRRT